MCRLAGELCDGFHVHPLPLAQVSRRESCCPNLEKGSPRPAAAAPTRSRCRPARSSSPAPTTRRSSAPRRRCAADRVLRVDAAPTSRVLEVARLGRDQRAAEREGRQGRLGGHGRRDHRRDARGVRGVGNVSMRSPSVQTSTRAISTAWRSTCRSRAVDDDRWRAIVRAFNGVNRNRGFDKLASMWPLAGAASLSPHSSPERAIRSER